MYYNYHGTIKKKLKLGLYSYHEYIDNYHNIKPALIIHFKDGSKYPIREYRWHEYYSLLKKSNKHL